MRGEWNRCEVAGLASNKMLFFIKDYGTIVGCVAKHAVTAHIGYRSTMTQSSIYALLNRHLDNGESET